MHAAMEDLKYGINVHNGSSEKNVEQSNKQSDKPNMIYRC